MHKQAINHKQAIIGGGYLFTENACYLYFHWEHSKLPNSLTHLLYPGAVHPGLCDVPEAPVPAARGEPA